MMMMLMTMMLMMMMMVEGREARAAAAIQGRWRRYRQRRTEREERLRVGRAENTGGDGGGCDTEHESDENMAELEDSVANLTERSGVEPAVELRYGETGGRTSTVTALESLPGPSRVVT